MKDVVSGACFGTDKAPEQTIGAKSRALRSIAPDAALGSSSSDEVSVASRADFPEVSLHLWDPRNGSCRRSVVSSARKTLFLEHVPSCMLFAMQNVVIRQNAS